MRACLYARYSTDKQRETSIDDQLRAARDRVAREGWVVAVVHTDEEVSGSTPIGLRTGGRGLQADVLARRWDVLIVESLDRIVRDIGEQEQFVKRVEHRGIRIIGTADGYDSLVRGRKVMRVARGLVNELYLDDLREKTHRGLAGQFDRGLSAGGRSYGYRSVEAGGGKQMQVDEAEAANVRWIFERFAGDGWSVQRIARELNAKGVPSARGSTWAATALNVSATKGTGLLNNELYIGRVVWNRRQWLKDPETGKRLSVERPPEEWQVRDAPELRIVDQALWDKARERMGLAATRGAGTSAALKRGRPARTLFGGLLTCYACGGPVIAVNALRYGCNLHKDRGPVACTNNQLVRRDVLDRRLVSEVRDDLLEPSVMATLRAAAKTALQARLREAGQGGEAARKRLQVVEGEISRLVDAVAIVGISPALTQRLQAAEAERKKLQAELLTATPQADVGQLVDRVAAKFKQTLMQLQSALEQQEDRERTRHILAKIVGPVKVVWEDGETFAEFEEPAERLLLAAVGESLNVVAGARSCNKRRVRLQ